MFDTLNVLFVGALVVYYQTGPCEQAPKFLRQQGLTVQFDEV